MTDSPTQAVLLWTGGKDSAMALYEAADNGCEIVGLATFAPPQAAFRAHPLEVIKRQAQALALPHRTLPVEKPFEQGYEAALRRLRNQWGIECIVTGDIAPVAGRPNWIRERCRPLGLQVCTPLWGRDRDTLLRQLLERGFEVRISCVDTVRLDTAWVGRNLDDHSIPELRATCARNGLDLCGEQGEYHTLVTRGPGFRRGISIDASSTQRFEALAYLAIHEMGWSATGGHRATNF